MEKFVQLAADIGKLWGKYGGSYLTAMRNTLILALVGTVIGCLIGFACGVLNTIPCGKNEPRPKRRLLKLCLGGGELRRVHEHRRLHGRVRPGRHHRR